MKLWIRVDAASPNDPKFSQLGTSLAVRPAEAYGLCVAVWCAMAEHARDGDLTRIDDRMLERWAMWDGRHGRFAKAFRGLFLEDGGVVKGWRSRQGKLAEQMEKDRNRHRKNDGTSEVSSEEVPRKLRGNSAGNSGATVTETVRRSKAKSIAAVAALEPSAVGNGQHPPNVAPDTPAVAPPPTRGGGWPARISAVFARHGVTEPPGKVGKVLEHAAKLHPPDKLVEALEWFLAKGVAVYEVDPSFLTLNTFAKNPGYWVEQVSPVGSSVA